MADTDPRLPTRLLLVEDDEDDVAILREVLKKIPEPFELEWARTGEEGLEALRIRTPDICLCDYFLGATTGLEFLAEAAKQGTRSPIVILTGIGGRQTDLAVMKAGAADFLPKRDLDWTKLERSLRYARERSELTESLRRSQQELRRIIDQLPLGLVVREGEWIVWANAAAATIFGVEHEGDLVGKSPLEFVHPDDRDGLRRRLSNPTAEPPVDVRFIRPDGEPVTVEVPSRPFPITFEGAAAFLVAFRDVTEQRAGAKLLEQRANRRKTRPPVPAKREDDPEGSLPK